MSLFLNELSPKMQAKLIKEIALLKKNGPQLGEPYSKVLNDGIYELRCQTEGNTSRIFLLFVSGKKVIMTNGFVKKSEKTPPYELEKAICYRQDHLDNQHKEK